MHVPCSIEFMLEFAIWAPTRCSCAALCVRVCTSVCHLGLIHERRRPRTASTTTQESSLRWFFLLVCARLSNGVLLLGMKHVRRKWCRQNVETTANGARAPHQWRVYTCIAALYRRNAHLHAYIFICGKCTHCSVSTNS